MAANFQYTPRIAQALAKMQIDPKDKFNIMAILERRDRDLEDYLATINARLTAGGL